jgi:hypothetical protein
MNLVQDNTLLVVGLRTAPCTRSTTWNYDISIRKSCVIMSCVPNWRIIRTNHHKWNTRRTEITHRILFIIIGLKFGCKVIVLMPFVVILHL